MKRRGYQKKWVQKRYKIEVVLGGNLRGSFRGNYKDSFRELVLRGNLRVVLGGNLRGSFRG